jgi:hypothetical protein
LFVEGVDEVPSLSPAGAAQRRSHAAIRAMYEIGKHTIDTIAAAHYVSRPTITAEAPPLVRR